MKNDCTTLSDNGHIGHSVSDTMIHHVIITVRTADQSEDVENVLREAEENGDLDFPFGCQITTSDVVVGDAPRPVNSTEYSTTSIHQVNVRKIHVE